MGDGEKEQLIVDTQLSREPEIGRWLWALQNTRQRTMREIARLTPAMIDWPPGHDDSSIGAILYHLADIEADWLYVEGLARPIPPEVRAIFPQQARDEQGHLTQVMGDTLEEHVSRLETVRGLLLEAYGQMTLAEFRQVRALEPYDVTPEYVLHHLMQHEAEHRSQIGGLRIAAQRALAQ
ncbi:conserved protein of unknown function [Candidatus Promineifilum breve]|uniref:DinB-like domain-containing protein n=1 Tax=Candidatus Promineifilum breve TaxID=1806508 RepID=A0A160T2K9_9CHLR|nr:DinB family protein [Candidatus Promineifilum breve]CUS03852.2 conserved protein of unknown function [Candidatus Promineifilum breve]